MSRTTLYANKVYIEILLQGGNYNNLKNYNLRHSLIHVAGLLRNNHNFSLNTTRAGYMES